MSDDFLEELCEQVHEDYEAAAAGPDSEWVTNPLSRKPWADVPEANKRIMRAALGPVADEIETLRAENRKLHWAYVQATNPGITRAEYDASQGEWHV